jgi:two-component system, LuxR family, sensor kinase FixL
VLNSVNVSVNLAVDRLRKLRLPSLTNAAELLAEHQEDLASYLGEDNQGRKLPPFLLKLSRHLTEEQESLIRELNGLKSNVDHIKQIVSMQQSYARISGAMEPLLVPELFEDALRVSAAALAERQVEVAREFEPVPPILVDRHKTLQILVSPCGFLPGPRTGSESR